MSIFRAIFQIYWWMGLRGYLPSMCATQLWFLWQPVWLLLSTRMNLNFGSGLKRDVSVLKILIAALMTATSLAKTLPCEFNFDYQNGYSCKAVNFTNVNRHARITKVIGRHLYQTDTNYRNRTNESVVRLVMYNAIVPYLPGSLTEVFPYLKTLQVKKCGLKSLEKNSEFQSLIKLFLGFNEIDRIPVNYFWHFCKLQILSLYGNRISTIPKMAFRDLISLKRLSLNSNRLKELEPNLFDNCLSLEYVDLDNNLLEYIDGRLFNNRTNLKILYLRHNQIDSIGNDFLSTMPALEFALFQNNTCIDESFPETPLAKRDKSPLEYIQSVFRDDCTPPITTSTTTQRPTTTIPRKKPKYRGKRIYYFENCRWHAPSGNRYF